MDDMGVDWTDRENVADAVDDLTAALVARLDGMARAEAVRLGGGPRALLAARAAMRTAAMGLWDADAPMAVARLIGSDPQTAVWLPAVVGGDDMGDVADMIPDLFAAIRAQAQADRTGRPAPLKLGEAGLTVMVAPYAPDGAEA